LQKARKATKELNLRRKRLREKAEEGEKRAGWLRKASRRQGRQKEAGFET
jgi:hypothetical protein